MRLARWTLYAAIAAGNCGCIDGSHRDATILASPPTAALDAQLRSLIKQHGLTGDPALGRSLPAIDDALPQLGKRLFFSMSLGGEFDTACASCHHPALGGADGLSLSVGIRAVAPEVLGPGRRNPGSTPAVPRNAPTTFNVGLFDRGLFWDSRVASLGGESGQNGAASGISTPDSGYQVIDPLAGANLAAAQARFPVTSVDEMRGDLEAGASNQALRDHLAGRLGNYGSGIGELPHSGWLDEFRTAFVSAADGPELITVANITAALADYQRSQVFVHNPWRDYVEGHDGAITDPAKRGAILFLTAAQDGGAGCAGCHAGDFFTDERHHALGTPQFGPGKGNPGSHDFGRENVTGFAGDRFRFRTPSLLNVALTGPYMHAGTYAQLEDAVRHHIDPAQTADAFFAAGGWCALAQFSGIPGCVDLYPEARSNTRLALEKAGIDTDSRDAIGLPRISLDEEQVVEITAFLHALTDPCVTQRDCIAAWIPAPDEDPDGHQLNAVDRNGVPF